VLTNDFENFEYEDDEDLDPELIAAIDKEVEEFRKKLEDINKQSTTLPKIPLPVPVDNFHSSCVY